MKNILILSSKNGSNFEAIIKYFQNRTDINFELLCDNKDAKVLKRANKLKIPAIFLEKESICKLLRSKKYDLVVMAGFYQILDKNTIEKNTFINIHPSLLPKYKGLKAIEKAYYNRDLKTGITIHYANEFVDSGEIIFQKEIEINPKWSLKKLEQEIHKQEHFFYPRIIEKLLGLNVLVVGTGAREHAIAQKVSVSRYLDKLYLADCNDGFSDLGEVINFSSLEELSEIAKEKNINLALVGSEKYFAQGIVDIFSEKGIKIIGLNKNSSRLETSKLFAKRVMQKYSIKTSPYKKISKVEDIDTVLSCFKTPVIKADGLAGGKGVYLNSDINLVKQELRAFLEGKFGDASRVSLVEEKLDGFEISLFSFWDGKNILHFPLCRDFKQNEKGLNTGGLAAICPINIGLDNESKLNAYKEKLKTMLQKEKINSPCIIYSGLISARDDIYVLEYNIRLGDPETQALLNYIKNDWLEIFFACANQMLNFIKLENINKEVSAIVLYSDGYPLFGHEIEELRGIENTNPSLNIYFSNIMKKDGKLFSKGGRILSAVSTDKNAIYKYFSNIIYRHKKYENEIKANTAI